MKICKCFMKGTCKCFGILVIQYISWIDSIYCAICHFWSFTAYWKENSNINILQRIFIYLLKAHICCVLSPPVSPVRRDKGTRRQWTYSGCNLVTIVRWQMGPGDLARLGSGSGRHVSSCNTCTGRYVLEFCDSFVKSLGSVTLTECRWKIKPPESTRMRIYI